MKKTSYVLVFLVIATIMSTTIVALSENPQDYYKVLIGGIQIYIDVPDSNDNNDLLCSIGFPAYYYVPPTAPDRPGYYVFGFVTASHCGEESFGVYQPDKSNPSFYRGYIKIDPKHPRLTDSAFVKTEISYGTSPTTITDKVLYYNSEIPIIGYVTIDSLEPTTTIYKTGRTTGTTYGKYVGIDSFILKDYDGENIHIVHSIESLYDCDHGDSGGTVYLVERFGGSIYAWVLGIHNGRTWIRYDSVWVEVGISSPYNDTIADLGVEAYG